MNPSALKHDKIPSQYSLQIEVNLNQPTHTHNTQTITVLNNISGHVPDRIVGDGDSLSVENQKRYASIIRYNPDQETNDQTKAVNYLMEKGFRRIAIVGATGRREDHTLGNISLLMEYIRMGAEVRMYTDYGFFVPMKGDCRFFCRKGVQVSIFAFGTQGLRGEGLAYPLRDFTNWWQGTLNEATGEEFVIRGEGE